MNRLAWLAVLVAIGMVGGAVVAGLALRYHDQRTVAARSTQASPVLLQTALSVERANSIVALVATVSITNEGDKPLFYLGITCLDPATVAFHSTRAYPPAPRYGASAAALRTKILDYRRSLDEAGLFEDAPGDQSSTNPPCDKTAVPALPPHQTLRFTQRNDIAAGDYSYVDSASTDVVTTVQLAKFPDPAHPTVLQPTRKVEVSTPLASVVTVVKLSDAQYDLTSKRFDDVMHDPSLAKWIDSQDPGLWWESRIQDGYPLGAWTLSAVNGAWAVPLAVSGSGDAITSTRIPAEKKVPAPSVAAVLPPDTSAHGSDYVVADDYSVGDLVLPSGLVMVGDPVSSDDMLKFDYGLKPGSYAMHVVTARPRYLGSEWARNAWETLDLTDQPVVRWEPAIPAGHSKSELKPGYTFQWGTDGGEGGFASPEAMKVMDADLSTQDQPVYYDLGARQEANDWLFAMATVDPATGANVFVCQSGFGDGGYPVFVGLDARGKPAVLLSDFGVVGLSYSGY